MTSITNPDEFRAYARQILRDMPDPDPSTAADKILGELSAVECRVALTIMLPDWLRNCSRTIDHQIRRSEPKTAAIAPNSSARRRLINDWWHTTLETRLHVGDQYKFLRECTDTDLLAAAKTRFDLAAANRVEAERWTETAELMRSNGYATVADIPAAKFRTIWQSS